MLAYTYLAGVSTAVNAVSICQFTTNIKETSIAIIFSGEKMEVEETCHDQYYVQPAGGSTACKIEGGTAHTFVCLYPQKVSHLIWLKLTKSNIWTAALMASGEEDRQDQWPEEW